MARADDPVLARRVACEIVRALRRAGHTALLAGGCVRDELLGAQPTDFDVATSASPAQVRALFPRTHDVGEAFGVILVREQRVTVEVATFRADGEYSDRRRPDSVTFSDAEQDAARRDFTINALFLDPAPDEPQPVLPGSPELHEHRDPASGSSGCVVDYVGGVRDLRAKVVRAVGNPEARLQEDHLRALRAVRFTARLGFSLDVPTAKAIAAHARELAGVSRERIGDEIRRMLAHPRRAQAVALLHDLGLDGPVLMDLPKAAVTLARLGVLPAGASLAASLATWALDRGDVAFGSAASVASEPVRLDRGSAPGAEDPKLQQVLGRWREALCLSNDERAALRGALAGASALSQVWTQQGLAGKRRLAGAPWFFDALEVLDAQNRQAASVVRYEYEGLKALPGGVTPEPVVTGDDLVALGLRPGKAFKRLLDTLYDAQLENSGATKSELLELARKSGV